MPHDVLSCLSDILTSIESIEEYLTEFLGERRDFDINNARKIITTRNYVAHGYDKVDNETIWGIIIIHLPALRAEVEKLLPAQ
ncbi:MAG: DUF86 domain-containing protein [Tannerellaceae bacterium]|jgi:uncharacterized protein with HEPN domain|nr:DUF86 domain-containing protein [Tannerellaceae bacterium]